MDIQTKKINKAIKAIRKECLKGFEKAANKCLAIFPDAGRNALDAILVLNLVGSQAHESLDLFLRQFAVELDHSIGECWLEAAKSEIDETIENLEAEALS